MKKLTVTLMTTIAVSMMFITQVRADAPMLLNYQGNLTDPSGIPKNGTFSMTFTVWNAVSGGNQLPSGTPWSENQTVAVTDGVFNVLLGSVTDIPADLFEGGPTDGKGPLRFLQVVVGGETLAPRKRIGSAAYAIEAPKAPRTYVEVFLPEDTSQGPLAYNTPTRVNFTRENHDDLGEWDVTTKEFTAKNAGLYLVQAKATFSEALVDGSRYVVSIQSNNESPTDTTKALFSSISPATGTYPVGGLPTYVGAVLQLSAGQKIWVVVDHTENSANLPSLYWRRYTTFLYITRVD